MHSLFSLYSFNMSFLSAQKYLHQIIVWLKVTVKVQYYL